ncbi:MULTISPECIES: hypothetical protein [unclassified Streptomyces]|uniref:hypothetical protein n=1 Tax=unclassified Streptomyces TaxID=2593676 RepID=UPI0016608A5A|nr:MULTISPECIES: hypothetical protein [unclassified Streptomyces]MBD0710945.1 hypothetical protein [Streptomyces sp. CBMA291]MBD0717480.1 hypothetical protein [Streptomyces sp. CBMA370]
MSEPNPYKPEGYEWGPGQQPPVPGQDYPQAPAYQPPVPGGMPMPPQHAPMPLTGGAPLLSLGDITVVGDQIITPAGPMPLKGAVWNATDMSRTEEKIPTVAIVLAIVFFLFCLLGLLFLLMKEKQTTGFIQITVTSGGRHHSTMIPARGPDTFPWVMGQLNYARSLSI